ncbi:MAG: hypothetical protein LM573_05770, partial [Thermofilum sp.]|nr:hypothetical protein [Thermofilum sp.]
MDKLEIAVKSTYFSINMPEKFEPYHTYVAKNYSPDLKQEVVVTFRVTPAEGFTIEDAAGGIAAESSVGTWTTLYEWYDRNRLEKLKGKAYF